MLNILSFIRDGISYTLYSDGKFLATGGASEASGTWTAVSEFQRNELTLTPETGADLIVPVTYAFYSAQQLDGSAYENVLSISVPGSGGAESAESLFAGQIIVDDRRDIEYQLTTGQKFYLYGELSFSPNYRELILTLNEGRATSVSGIARIDKNPGNHLPNEQDLLSFVPLTRWIDIDSGTSGSLAGDVKLSGHIAPVDGQLKFFGTIQGSKTFDIALAGTYKVVSGAINIYANDGQTFVDLAVKGSVSFRGTTGQFFVAVGNSATEKLSINAQLSFESASTDQTGRATISGAAAVSGTAGAFVATLQLAGQFKMSPGNAVQFELDAGINQGKVSVAFAGQLTVGNDRSLSFKLAYSGGNTVITLALDTPTADFWVQIASDGSGLQVGFSVTYTFPDASSDTPTASVPIPTAGGGTSALLAPAAELVPPLAPAFPGPSDITPETYAAYPRTGHGCFNAFTLLHPVVRRAVTKVQNQLHAEGIPLFVFESFRSPQRQNKLFAKTPKVTNARAWSSYHQYGMAVDFVFHENGKWHWGKNSKHTEWYKRLHKIALEHDLEPLSWEKPHLQHMGLSISMLRQGQYPAGGDSDWGMHLAGVIEDWSDADGTPDAPPAPSGFADFDRPELPAESDPSSDTGRRCMTEADVGDADKLHSRFGGQEWKVKVSTPGAGVILKGKTKPERTHGEPITCRKIVELYDDIIRDAAIEFDVPEELLIMTIATETAFARGSAFTGALTFRWEPGIAEYSAGPMQVLSRTARALITKYRLPLDPNAVAPKLSNKPQNAPTHLPLFDPEVSIMLGALAIKDRQGETGNDPILVAAMYNAGSLRDTTANEWHLHSTGDHLNRAARWFGDVFAI